MSQQFVSRAGEKLQSALDSLQLSVDGLIVADFGSSTGGFVDCLLHNGAKKIYSVDTSYGELAWKLRNDPRVIVLERTNAMHVILPEKMDLITVDTSWTKQEKVIPNALRNLKNNGQILTLIKPHYEAKKDELDKGRVKVEFIEQVLQRVREDIEGLGGKIVDIVESPILGKRGENKEYIALVVRSAQV